MAANSVGASRPHTPEDQNVAPLGPVGTEELGSFEHDFVIISEFSEQLGPVPLLITPEGNEGKFDVPNFVVRTLAVDFQRSSDPCNVPEDTQVVFTLPSERAHCYVHHFTLYDIHARGYVRPVCVSYVTRDARKIMDNFENMRNDFLKATSLLKLANQLVFLRDLQHRVADLQLTKTAVLDQIKTTVTSDAAKKQMVTETALENYMHEMEQMEARLRENITATIHDDRRLAEHFNVPKAAHGDYEPQVVKTLHKVSEFDRRLRPLTELCAIGYPPAIARLKRIQHDYSKAATLLALERDDAQYWRPESTLLLVGNEPIVNFDFRLDSYSKAAKEARAARRPIVTRSRATSTSSASSECASVFHEESSFSTSPTASFEDARSCMDEDHPRPHRGSISRRTRMVDENADEEPSHAASMPAMGTEWPGGAGHRAAAPITPWDRKPPWGGGGAGGGAHQDYGMLRLVRKYAWTKHLLYALLKGRPVVIHAHQSHKETVKSIVQTLSMFVPGTGYDLYLWRRKSLQVADLATMRLCGLARQSVIPPAVLKHVTVFDYDLEELRTPPYKGGVFLEELLADKKWPDEETFMAHVRHVLLQMGLKACIHYYMCCVGMAPCCITQPLPGLSWITSTLPTARSELFDTAPLGDETASERDDGMSDSVGSIMSTSADAASRKHRAGSVHAGGKRPRSSTMTSDPETPRVHTLDAPRETDRAIFRQLRIQESDADIIAYFSETVKMQQMREVQMRLGGAEFPSTIRLDNQPVELFRNRVPK